MVSNDSERGDVPSVHRPRIALTTYFQDGAWGDWNAKAAIVPATYVEGVVNAGGVPVLLPPLGTDTSVLDFLDGLLVIGGSDVDPVFYGQERHERTAPHPLRDQHDILLTQAAIERGLPLFAICRGAQILNVAMGGTLVQHLPDVNAGAAQYQPAPGQYGRVHFSTVPGSRCAQLLGETAESPCYHHQALNEVAPGLRVTARAEDGTIEAVEPVGGGWALGVQFHPEQNSQDVRLFEGFISAARDYAREVPSRTHDARSDERTTTP